MPAGVIMADAATGERVLINERATEILGAGMMTGSQVGEMAHQLYRTDGRPYTYDELPLVRSMTTGEIVRDEEIPVLRSDCRCLYILASSIPIRDQEGRIAAGVVIFTDISERKKAELDLQRERAFLRQVIDAAPSMIFVKSWDGRFVLASVALARCYGTTVEGVVGKTDADFNPNIDELDHFLHDDRQVMSNRQEMLIPEEKVTSADGEVHWFTTIKAPLINPDGTCDKLLGVASDITDRKLAEEKLRLQNERLMLLSDVAAHLLKAEKPEMMIRELFENVSKHLDLQIYMKFLVNETGGALRLDSCAGLPEDVERQLQCLEFGQGCCGAVALRRQPLYASDVGRSSDENLRLLKELGVRAYACYPLLAGNRLLGTLAFATCHRDSFHDDDLAFMSTICQYVAMSEERQRLESELRRNNNQLAEADQRKNEFLAMLAHELRNPLAPIRNAVQVMRLAGSPRSGHAAPARHCRPPDHAYGAFAERSAGYLPHHARQDSGYREAPQFGRGDRSRRGDGHAAHRIPAPDSARRSPHLSHYGSRPIWTGSLRPSATS